MRRRRLLAAVVTLGAGCTSTGYRRSGPRSVPTAPPTDAEATPTPDPSVERIQAVVQPLNEAYRLVRTPLDSFEVADVSDETLSNARSSLTRARESLSDAVDDSTGAYRSLPTLVTAHELLFDALVTAVDLYAELRTLVTRDTPVEGVSARIEPLRSSSSTLTTRAAELADIVSSEPTVPPSLFVTLDRLDAFATGLDRQATAVRRLLDVVERALTARADWQSGVDAFERGSFAASGTAFTDARDHYRDGATLLDGDLRTEGSFADVTDLASCVVDAGLDAVSLALRAVDIARAGDVERGRERLETADTRRNRCRGSL